MHILKLISASFLKAAWDNFGHRLARSPPPPNPTACPRTPLVVQKGLIQRHSTKFDNGRRPTTEWIIHTLSGNSSGCGSSVGIERHESDLDSTASLAILIPHQIPTPRCPTFAVYR